MRPLVTRRRSPPPHAPFADCEDGASPRAPRRSPSRTPMRARRPRPGSPPLRPRTTRTTTRPSARSSRTGATRRRKRRRLHRRKRRRPRKRLRRLLRLPLRLRNCRTPGLAWPEWQDSPRSSRPPRLLRRSAPLPCAVGARLGCSLCERLATTNQQPRRAGNRRGGRIGRPASTLEPRLGGPPVSRVPLNAALRTYEPSPRSAKRARGTVYAHFMVSGSVGSPRTSPREFR